MLTSPEPRSTQPLTSITEQLTDTSLSTLSAQTTQPITEQLTNHVPFPILARASQSDLPVTSALTTSNWRAACGGEEEKEAGAQPQTPVKGLHPFASRFANELGRNTSMRLPVVIPASTKRLGYSLQRQPSQQHRPMLLLSVLLGSIIMLIAAGLFVIPLNNDQQQLTGLQTFGSWISTGQFAPLNPAQHRELPTATPALLTGEGYCGGNDLWGTCATAITASGLMGTGQMQRPIQGAVITQGFARSEYQQWCGCWRPHTGIDLAAPYGTPIMAADNGQVIWAGWDWSGLGWAVKMSHGHYIATIYGHMQRFVVRGGQNVKQGQIIGYEGSTGASTGPHVHFMVLNNNIWVNPLLYVPLP